MEEAKEPKEYPYYNGRQPVVITSYMDSRITCTHCASENIEQNHNSVVLLLVDGSVAAYFHAFCNDCWKENEFVIEIMPRGGE